MKCLFWAGAGPGPIGLGRRVSQGPGPIGLGRRVSQGLGEVVRLGYLSTTMATPWPPPMQRVARPYLESLFIIS